MSAFDHRCSTASAFLADNPKTWRAEQITSSTRGIVFCASQASRGLFWSRKMYLSGNLYSFFIVYES